MQQDGYRKKPKALMGGAGLASTAMDYARFIQMLLNGGQLDGVRILGRKTVELMSTDHLNDLARPGASPPRGYGMGLTRIIHENEKTTLWGALNTVPVAAMCFWSGIRWFEW